ncbi:hypothetical protein PSECIP111951_00472 [Pseudoalteromonas holothuriae]|uniref:Lipoprotein n=1 Tax=Pseudoalteromonas holothuriae TaxID=2963714 RepID=A0A9W4QR93_9GAMM|nr:MULTISPECIES: YajG family lipoprotein [unclassified Pseudoalteromonas]CAH9049787.1 hypothetical protein PSECIP111854_00367 [Pseudoalteromonas sp. CIP111854]CAH9051781.1 hypothetical protein PSECIP111951_00472 [Pseudoalteromonas sp. CIP111951]
MKLLTTLFIVLLTGCASAPKSVILSPIYSAGKISQFNVPIQLNVEDNRVSNFTIRVLDQEPALYLPDAALPKTIGATLRQALQTNGAKINTAARSQVILHINEFTAQVTESLTKHQSHAQAKFSVEIIQETRRFEKSYSAKAQLNGPLKHEQAKVEGQLNDLTEMLITRIVSDKELVKFLQGS